ncbi:hypothetical protein PDJAM_G00037760 [Pangasius djambal]|uniref:Uncharacterized protein n=1 Tax=Pangasius djambal TaxID=1691987 RepID=A0ACC5YUB4_9TELE|nr:hypothetical protein [Pangasius djambal]
MQSFEMDFKKFQTHITDYERRLGTIFCQAFEDCAFPESATKLFEMFGFVLERPLLLSLISSKYKKLLEMFSLELDRIKLIYDAQMAALEICQGAPPIAKNMPPVAGQLKWAQELRDRLQTQSKSIKAIHHMCIDTDEVKLVCQKYDEMMDLLHNYCDRVYAQWSAKVDIDCKFNLGKPLLLRNQKTNVLSVNFNKQHDRFGGGSVMVWGGISMEGRTDLYRLDNGTLTAIRYRDEILGPIVRPYAGAVGPGFLLVHYNARAHVGKVCRQFLEDEGIDTIE